MFDIKLIAFAFIIATILFGLLYIIYKNTLGQKEGFEGYDGIYDGALTIQTISNSTKDQINSILGQILNHLNEKTGKRYFLRKIDRLNVMPMTKGDVGCEKSFQQTGEFVLGARYTVDFFAHELINQETRRFITIFTVNPDFTVAVEHLSYSNAFLDENAVNTTGQEYKPMSGPGSLIIEDESLLVPNKYHVQGLKDATGLDSHPFKAEGDIPAGHAGTWEMTQVFLPISFNISAEKYHADRLWPNRRQSKWWDSNGVFITEDTDIKNGRVGLEHGNTYGLNNAMLNPSFNGRSQMRPPGVYDNPTVVRMNSNAYDNKNHWMFDVARGNLAMGQAI
jgi:hypothetical protein